MRGWLVEEIRIVYKESNVDEIFKKYETVFYNFEIMKSRILNTITNLEIFFNNNEYKYNKEAILENSNKHFNNVISNLQNPPDFDEILNMMVEETISENNKNLDKIVIL